VTEQWNRLPRKVLEPPSLDIQQPSSRSPGQVDLGGLAAAGELEKGHFRTPFQCPQFCDSVILNEYNFLTGSNEKLKNLLYYRLQPDCCLIAGE